MKKLRFGFVGCGGWARKKYLPYLVARDDVEVVAASRIVEPAEQDSLRQAIPLLRLYERESEMLAAERLDGVLVSLPHAFIADGLRSVIQHRLPVITDKPFTISATQADELVRLADEQGVALAVSHQRRAYPNVAVARQVLAGCDRAPLRWISASFYLHSYPGWRVGWRNDPELAGHAALRQGILLDAGYHLLDAILFLLDFELPRRVICSASYRDARVETDVSAILEFPGERRATLQISRDFPESYELEALDVLGNDWFLHSSIRKGGGNTAASYQLHQSGLPGAETAFSIVDAPTLPLEAFLRHLYGESLPAIWSARTSVVTLRVMDALYRSVGESAPVILADGE